MAYVEPSSLDIAQQVILHQAKILSMGHMFRKTEHHPSTRPRFLKMDKTVGETQPIADIKERLLTKGLKVGQKQDEERTE